MIPFRIMSRTIEIKDLKELKELAVTVRSDILNISYEANASHIGSALSCVEILISVYSSLDINAIIKNSDTRDRVILSKGHAAAALYSTLKAFGLITANTLASYRKPESVLMGHVSHEVFGVEHSTGALGHGLSVGVGHAIYLKEFSNSARVYVICGDGEIQEGSVWEALMLISTRNLNNLVVLIDSNKISSITDTEKVINTGKLEERFKGFGFNVISVNGHDIKEIMKAIGNSNNMTSPTVVVCNTVKGKGVSFAENSAVWHYKTLTHETLEIALNELK